MNQVLFKKAKAMQHKMITGVDALESSRYAEARASFSEALLLDPDNDRFQCLHIPIPPTEPRTRNPESRNLQPQAHMLQSGIGSRETASHNPQRTTGHAERATTGLWRRC